MEALYPTLVGGDTHSLGPGPVRVSIRPPGESHGRDPRRTLREEEWTRGANVGVDTPKVKTTRPQNPLLRDTTGNSEEGRREASSLISPRPSQTGRRKVHLSSGGPSGPPSPFSASHGTRCPSTPFHPREDDVGSVAVPLGTTGPALDPGSTLETTPPLTLVPTRDHHPSESSPGSPGSSRVLVSRPSNSPFSASSTPSEVRPSRRTRPPSTP